MLRELDFVDNQGPTWWLKVPSRDFAFRLESKQRPLPCIRNDKFPNVSVELDLLFYCTFWSSMAFSKFILRDGFGMRRNETRSPHADVDYRGTRGRIPQL